MLAIKAPRSRRRPEKATMNLKEVGRNARNWMELAQYKHQWRAYLRAAVDHRVP